MMGDGYGHHHFGYLGCQSRSRRCWQRLEVGDWPFTRSRDTDISVSPSEDGDIHDEHTTSGSQDGVKVLVQYKGYVWATEVFPHAERGTKDYVIQAVLLAQESVISADSAD